MAALTERPFQNAKTTGFGSIECVQDMVIQTINKYQGSLGVLTMDNGSTAQYNTIAQHMIVEFLVVPSENQQLTNP